MKIESENDFVQYLNSKTLSELEQISNSINRNLYRQRYEIIQRRIRELQSITKKPDTKSFAEKEKLQIFERRHSFFEILLLLVCEFFVAGQGFLAFFGIAWGRGESHTAWTFFEQTIPFLVIIFVIVSLFSLMGKFGRATQGILVGISLYFIIPYFASDLLLFAFIPPTLLAYAVFWVNSSLSQNSA